MCIPSPQFTLNVTVPPDKSNCFQIKWSKQIFDTNLLFWNLDWGDPDGLTMTSSKHHIRLHANSFFLCRTWSDHELLSCTAFKLLLNNGGCWHPFRVSFYSTVFKGFDVIALPQMMWNHALRKYPSVSAISLRLAWQYCDESNRGFTLDVQMQVQVEIILSSTSFQIETPSQECLHSIDCTLRQKKPTEQSNILWQLRASVALSPKDSVSCSNIVTLNKSRLYYFCIIFIKRSKIKTWKMSWWQVKRRDPGKSFFLCNAMWFVPCSEVAFNMSKI